MPVQLTGKLVRDLVPKHLAGKNIRFTKRRIEDRKEFIQYLFRKLEEEIGEFKTAKTVAEEIEEAGDIMEVLYALFNERGISPTRAETTRAKKLRSHGGFKRKIILLETITKT